MYFVDDCLKDPLFKHSISTLPLRRGGELDLWTQQNPGRTEIFQNQGGKKKDGGVESLKFSLGKKLLEMKLHIENKFSEWI